MNQCDKRIAELEETIAIICSGSDNDAIEMLGARYKDAADENRLMREALCSVLAISKELKGESARQIRDIIINALEDIEEDTP